MNEITVIILLILLNGVFSLAEISLISARKSRLKTDAKQGKRAAQTALKLAEEPDRFLSTIQIGITLIGILTGLYSGDVLANDFAQILIQWGIPTGYAHPVAQTLIVITVTYLSIVAGELVPKRIGLNLADRAAVILAPPMYLLSVIGMPFVWILSKSTSLIVRMLGIREGGSRVTEEEIKSIIKEGAEAGEVQEVEQDIMERVFILGDMKISSLMTYRKDIVCLDLTMTAEEVQQVIHENLFEAYPVKDGSLEHISGIVTLKELILNLNKKDFALANVIAQPLYLPETLTVYKSLEVMKEQKSSRALVYDEYGSLQGIITLKDIMAGLVGSIDTATDTPPIIERKDHNGWLADGQCPIYEFLSFFEREDLNTTLNCNTLGGLIVEQLEHIPQTGERITWHNFNLEIIDMDGARIDKVMVTLTQE